MGSYVLEVFVQKRNVFKILVYWTTVYYLPQSSIFTRSSSSFSAIIDILLSFKLFLQILNNGYVLAEVMERVGRSCLLMLLVLVHMLLLDYSMLVETSVICSQRGQGQRLFASFSVSHFVRLLELRPLNELKDLILPLRLEHERYLIDLSSFISFLSQGLRDLEAGG
ncbi:MAG: hypothetical protein EZS28_002543 [Streblomastix strix]|uniref:Uncharacterized protein n=1 Tax=Streblomastix strix TaxID=222440 RepID=A0A5J4X3X9_9EUKA|nr:MAG: hypothetical protein EZS28_002543 [Streblomastix strix]